jgi:hypothetical protein
MIKLPAISDIWTFMSTFMHLQFRSKKQGEGKQ